MEKIISKIGEFMVMAGVAVATTVFCLLLAAHAWPAFIVYEFAFDFVVGLVGGLVLAMVGIVLHAWAEELARSLGAMWRHLRRAKAPMSLIIVALIAAGCATYPPAQPSGSRPPVIFTPPREAPRAEIRLPPADAPNPCGIPDVIVRFMREGLDTAGPKAVTNLNMPMEIEPVVNNWVRCASGKLVYSYNAPMQFVWTVKEQQIPNSVYRSSSDDIGSWIAGRVVRAFGAVVDGALAGSSVNGRSLGGGSYDSAYIWRVTVLFKLTGVNGSGQQQLAFQGEGRAHYDPNSQVYDRDWGFRRAALLALRNMH